MRPGGLVAFYYGVLGLGQHRDGALSHNSFDNSGIVTFVAGEYPALVLIQNHYLDRG